MDGTASEREVAPCATAGLLLAARRVLRKLGLCHPSVPEILETTGASRSRAYELCDELGRLLPGLIRPVGRPPREPDPPGSQDTSALSAEMLRFVIDHPGCVHGGAQRRRYAAAFRRKVLELRERYPGLELSAFAAAVCVPAGTVEDWLRPGRAPRESDAPEAPTRPPGGDEDPLLAETEMVIFSWRSWHGDFTSFCEHVRRDLRLGLGKSLIATILREHGERTPKRRPGRSPDEEALRNAFETFFPDAQWVGDGKEVAVTIDGVRLAFNLELLVDCDSGAFLGTSIRDTEDSEAVVEALEEATATTGGLPIAVLLDNRPSNHTSEVDGALDDAMRIRATQGRPQNKAHVEGAFGLFSQRMPSLEFETDDPRELGRQILRVVVELFARIINHRPRRDRDGKSRTELHREHPVTEEQRALARERLRERLRKQELARKTREARLDPAARELLDRAFERLDLIDPERHFRDAIARYPLDDVVDGIGTFEGKRERGTLPDTADARYLLGIVHNIHHLHEADHITNALLRERLAGRDLLLQPLVDQRDRLLQADCHDALRAFVDLALEASRTIDRIFWLDAAADLISVFPDEERPDLFRAAARRIHANFRVNRRRRAAAERFLARQLWPLS